MIQRFFAVASALLACLLSGVCSGNAIPAEFKAGAFAMDVTPLKFPISMNGNMQDNPARKAHDPLHARCLVLDDGKSRVAFVVVDNCVIRRELMDDAKQRASKLTGIPTERMLVSSTHAHSCPAVAGVFQSEPDLDYVEFLTERIAAGIKQANDNLAPARVAWGAVVYTQVVKKFRPFGTAFAPGMADCHGLPFRRRCDGGGSRDCGGVGRN